MCEMPCMFHECYRLHGNTSVDRNAGATCRRETCGVAGRTTFFLIHAINFHLARALDVWLPLPSPFFLFLCPGLSRSSLPVPCFLTQLLRCPVSPRIPPSSCFLLPTDENCGEVSLAKEELLWRLFCTADLFEEYRFRSLLIIYSFRIRKRIHIMVEIISVQMRKESSLTTRIGIKKRIRKTEDRKK